MNQRQRELRAGIREAKRTGEPFHRVEVASCKEPKVVDEAKVKAAIDKELAKASVTHPEHRKVVDRRKMKRLKSKIA
jgi:hypothetical protein